MILRRLNHPIKSVGHAIKKLSPCEATPDGWRHYLADIHEASTWVYILHTVLGVRQGATQDIPGCTRVFNSSIAPSSLLYHIIELGGRNKRRVLAWYVMQNL